MSREYPFITIVMPVLNEEAFINQTIQKLVDQQYPVDKMEILVVDGMSTDDTRMVIGQWSKKFPQVKLLDNPKGRSSAGRNIGFRAGRGDYFVVIDGHCFIPDMYLLENIVTCFEKSGADCLGRPQPLDPPGLSDFQKGVALARGARIGHGGDSFIFCEYTGFVSPTSNGAVYGRKVFERVGYVDEFFDACEDVEFNYRIKKSGLICYMDPSLTVQYYPRESLSSLFKQLSRYGVGRRRFVRKHPEAFTLNQLIPALFVLGLGFLLSCLLLLSISDLCLTAASVLAMPYLAYLGLIALYSIDLSLRNNWKNIYILPQIFFVIHFSLGWGFLKESFMMGKRVNG